MNGIHDIGGMHGLGPIEPEENEPVFHEDWERRVFGMTLATLALGQYHLDEFRHSIERMDPARYLSSSYYEHWLVSLETLFTEKGIITREELEARKAELARGAA